MRVAVDVDGVQYEWDKTARYMLRTHRGNTHLTSESTHWNYIQDTVSEEDWDWLWTVGVDKGLFRYGHLVRGAIEGLRALVRDGQELMVITARPKEAVRDTLAWLTLMDIPWNGIHILSNGEPKTKIEADVLIDDKPENVMAWAQMMGRTGFLFSRAWNIAIPDHLLKDWFRVVEDGHIIRVHGWSEVLPWLDTVGGQR
jgi:uncharacterized HAD superfamily protein